MLVKIELQCFLKFLRIEILDRSGGFSDPDGLPDQKIWMTEVGLTEGVICGGCGGLPPSSSVQL